MELEMTDTGPPDSLRREENPSDSGKGPNCNGPGQKVVE
jgi:hypothetical protein